MASACNNLAEFYRLRRQFDLAEPLYKQVWLAPPAPLRGADRPARAAPRRNGPRTSLRSLHERWEAAGCLHPSPFASPLRAPDLPAHTCKLRDPRSLFAEEPSACCCCCWPPPAGPGGAYARVRPARRSRRLCAAQPGRLLPVATPAGTGGRLLRAGAQDEARGAGHRAQVRSRCTLCRPCVLCRPFTPASLDTRVCMP